MAVSVSTADVTNAPRLADSPSPVGMMTPAVVLSGGAAEAMDQAMVTGTTSSRVSTPAPRLIA